MSKLKELLEKRNNLKAEVQAITDITVAEKREMTADERQRVDAIITDETGEMDKINADIKRWEKIEELAAEKIGKQLQEARQERDDAPKAIKVPATAKARHRLKAFQGPEAERDAYITGQFALAMVGQESSQQWLQDHGYNIKAAMSSNNNEKGGYLIPDVTEATIIRLVESFGVLRRNVGRVWPLNSGNINVPKRAGGFTFHWVGESQTINDSDPTLARVSLVAKKGAMLGKIPSELFEDSIVSLGDFLAQEMAFAKAQAEDNAGFNGDGTSAFGGIIGLKSALNAGAKADAPTGDGQTTIGGLKIGVFQQAMGALADYPGIDPKWYMSKPVFENGPARLAVAAGGNTTETIANGMRPMFLGYPVEFTQVLPKGGPTQNITSTIVAYFGDLSMAIAMGDARGLQIRADESVYFASDEIGVRGTCRLDINVHEKGTANEAGAVVAVVGAAS